jgi:hypothetical protein
MKPSISRNDQPTAGTRGLVNRMIAEDNSGRLFRERLGINKDSSISAHSINRNSQIHWRFLGSGVNYLEVGSSYYGDFISRVVGTGGGTADLILILWKACGSENDYQRISELVSDPLPPLALNTTEGLDEGLFNAGHLIEFSGEVKVAQHAIWLGIGRESIRVLSSGTEEVL